jgi:hypothetical protein
MAGPAAATPGTAFDADAVIAIAERLRGLEGPLLPILHAVVERFGHVDARAVPLIADVLNLSRAEVHGVVGFYHDFRARRPAGTGCASAAPRPARRWAARPWRPRSSAPRHPVRRDHARRPGDAGGGLLPRQLRPVAGRDGRRRTRGPGVDARPIETLVREAAQ